MGKSSQSTTKFCNIPHLSFTKDKETVSKNADENANTSRYLTGLEGFSFPLSVTAWIFTRSRHYFHNQNVYMIKKESLTIGHWNQSPGARSLGPRESVKIQNLSRQPLPASLHQPALAPLVFLFHSGLGSGQNIPDRTQWNLRTSLLSPRFENRRQPVFFSF